MNIATVLLILGVILYANASNPIGPCNGGRGVPVVPTDSGGACGYPPLPGVITTSVNQAFFDNGAKCGECYQVTGPLGTITVMVTDMCSQGAPKCGGDKDNFGIDQAGYFQIANSTTDIIFDLGYRRVTCDVTTIQFSISSDSNNYYFGIVVYNHRIGLSGVGVRGAGWSSFEALTRGTNSARWAWNKVSNTLQFPLVLSFVAESGEVLQYKVASWQAGSVVDTQLQFAKVPAGSGGLCPLSAAPQEIYIDTLTYGWSTSYSFNTNNINIADSTSSMSGTSLSVIMFGYGGLQFTRNGGYDPAYFDTLQFSAKANVDSPLRVYVGALADGETGGVTVTVTPQWQTFNISVADLKPDSVEFDLVFQNFQSNTMQFWFDNIQFSYAPVSPLANITYHNPIEIPLNETDPGSVTGTGLASTTKFNFDTGSGLGVNPSSSASILASSLFAILSAIVALLVVF